MVLKIKGGTKLQKKIIREYGSWLGDYLLGKHSEEVEVLFTFDPSLEAADCEGCTDWEDPSDTRTPREFVVSLNNTLSLVKLIFTIGHEMVHVKQYVKGELRQNMRKNNFSWKKQYFPIDVMDYIDERYLELPWEIEAHGREWGLYIMFLCQTKKKRYADLSGEFSGNVYDYNGNHLFSCVMIEEDGVIKPVDGHLVYNKEFKPLPDSMVMAYVRPSAIKKLVVNDRGFEYAD